MWKKLGDRVCRVWNDLYDPGCLAILLVLVLCVVAFLGLFYGKRNCTELAETTGHRTRWTGGVCRIELWPGGPFVPMNEVVYHLNSIEDRRNNDD